MPSTTHKTMILTANGNLDIPVSAGCDIQLSGLGTWNGATVTLYTYVDEAWRAVPDGAFTADFTKVWTNGDGSSARLALTSAGGSTSLSVNLTEIPKQ